MPTKTGGGSMVEAPGGAILVGKGAGAPGTGRVPRRTGRGDQRFGTVLKTKTARACRARVAPHHSSKIQRLQGPAAPGWLLTTLPRYKAATPEGMAAFGRVNRGGLVAWRLH